MSSVDSEVHITANHIQADGVNEVTAPCSIRLHVTPEIAVPQVRLPAQPLKKVLEQLATEESKKGLVDAGGMFEFDAAATLLSGGHPHGFIAAATAAFAQHYPLAVRPQHFWLMILQGIAKHAEQNAEEVRSKWVTHEGNKTLEVRCDEFSLGGVNNWASVVDGKPDCFSSQIDENVVEGVANELSPGFSNTSVVENIALKITVLDITKSFFSFKCCTECGFPFILMEGTLEDWIMLRRTAELLIKNRCGEQFANWWCESLLPVLDILSNEYQKGIDRKDPNEKFWNSMCKLGGTTGSGARTYYNGWINIFFPFIIDKPNQYMKPYSDDAAYVTEGRQPPRYGMRCPDGVPGPDCSDFPCGLASAPVEWDYNGNSINLTFKAGFVGAKQEQSSGVIMPQIGWFISHAKSEEEKEKQNKGNHFGS